jgi:hypothetical protein
MNIEEIDLEGFNDLKELLSGSDTIEEMRKYIRRFISLIQRNLDNTRKMNELHIDLGTYLDMYTKQQLGMSLYISNKFAEVRISRAASGSAEVKKIEIKEGATLPIDVVTPLILAIPRIKRYVEDNSDDLRAIFSLLRETVALKHHMQELEDRRTTEPQTFFERLRRRIIRRYKSF